MIIRCCDLCERPLGEWYEDENGKRWDDISFQQKKYRRKMFCFNDSWTEYLTICGRCRAELAKCGIGERGEADDERKNTEADTCGNRDSNPC